jgi:general secretion pathway protein G
MVKRQFSVRRSQFSVQKAESAEPASSTDDGELTTDNRTSGFTLLELMIVMVVIGILAAIAIPSYTANVKRAREAVLREDLHTMRSAIDSYTYDKQKAPQSLEDLVQGGYLKSIPVDPMTHRSDTWQASQSDSLMSIDQTEPGIDDVHSGSQELSTDGNATYNTW